MKLLEILTKYELIVDSAEQPKERPYEYNRKVTQVRRKPYF